MYMFWLPRLCFKFVPLLNAKILLKTETLTKMLTNGRADIHQSIDRNIASLWPKTRSQGQFK